MGEELPLGAGTAVVDGASDAVAEPLPIGEVLTLLQADFPDVTISKIRFLESQGLIQPERTASGYRRFSATDIERLRWILRQQRDHFLPLKVIRRMIEDGVDRYDPGQGSQPTLFSSSAQDAADAALDAEDHEDLTADVVDPAPSVPTSQRSSAHPAVRSAPPGTPRTELPGSTAAGARLDPRPSAGPGTERRTERASTDARSGGRDAGRAERSEPGGADGVRDRSDRRAPTAPPRAGTEPASDEGAASPTRPPAPPASDDDPAPTTPKRPPHETPADVVAALQEDPRPAPRSDASSRPSRPVTRRTTREPVDPEAQLGEDDLCASEGIESSLLVDLERYGLVQPHVQRGGAHTYGPEAIEVVRLAARYHELGIGPRHLRMYLVAAEREAGMVEQLAVPLLKQRNPRAREHAAELASELAELGADLHRSLLRREIGRDLLP